MLSYFVYKSGWSVSLIQTLRSKEAQTIGPKCTHLTLALLKKRPDRQQCTQVGSVLTYDPEYPKWILFMFIPSRMKHCSLCTCKLVRWPPRDARWNKKAHTHTCRVVCCLISERASNDHLSAIYLTGGLFTFGV